MSNTIHANVTVMFSEIEPCYVSGSVSELGECAEQLTWRNALSIAAKHEDWLLSSLSEAADAMRDWAKETGGWDEDERNGWSDEEALALFVQNVASELRLLGADDDFDLEGVAKAAEDACEGDAMELVGRYYVRSDTRNTHVEYYAGI
jgi:hypothetical protein